MNWDMLLLVLGVLSANILGSLLIPFLSIGDTAMTIIVLFAITLFATERTSRKIRTVIP